MVGYLFASPNNFFPSGNLGRKSILVRTNNTYFAFSLHCRIYGLSSDPLETLQGKNMNYFRLFHEFSNCSWEEIYCINRIAHLLSITTLHSSLYSRLFWNRAKNETSQQVNTWSAKAYVTNGWFYKRKYRAVRVRILTTPRARFPH